MLALRAGKCYYDRVLTQFKFHSFRSYTTTNAIRDTNQSSANPYPYPTQANPRPHQIFHLPHNASQEAIKQRYYELVRIYHPDSTIARHHPPEIAQARFHSITHAYDWLRGKSAVTGETLTSRPSNIRNSELWKGRQARRPHFDDTPGDERWKERTIMAAVLLTLVAFVTQTAMMRNKAWADMTAHGRPYTTEKTASRQEDALAESSDISSQKS